MTNKHAFACGAKELPGYCTHARRVSQRTDLEAWAEHLSDAVYLRVGTGVGVTVEVVNFCATTVALKGIVTTCETTALASGGVKTVTMGASVETRVSELVEDVTLAVVATRRSLHILLLGLAVDLALVVGGRKGRRDGLAVLLARTKGSTRGRRGRRRRHREILGRDKVRHDPGRFLSNAVHVVEAIMLASVVRVLNLVVVRVETGHRTRLLRRGRGDILLRGVGLASTAAVRASRFLRHERVDLWARRLDDLKDNLSVGLTELGGPVASAVNELVEVNTLLALGLALRKDEVNVSSRQYTAHKSTILCELLAGSAVHKDRATTGAVAKGGKARVNLAKFCLHGCCLVCWCSYCCCNKKGLVFEALQSRNDRGLPFVITRKHYTAAMLLCSSGEGLRCRRCLISLPSN